MRTFPTFSLITVFKNSSTVSSRFVLPFLIISQSNLFSPLEKYNGEEIFLSLSLSPPYFAMFRKTSFRYVSSDFSFFALIMEFVTASPIVRVTIQ